MMSHDDLLQGEMSLDDFLSFTEARPDGEKWELIDGVAILNASPNHPHQRIVANLISYLESQRKALRARWEAIPGMTIPISDGDAPIPDVLVRPANRLPGNICDDMLIAFEVLSKSTAKRDLGRKRSAYALLPTLQRYVVIAQETVHVRIFARANGWQEEEIKSVDRSLALPESGIEFPLRELYELTGLV